MEISLPDTIDILAIDCNEILHTAAQMAYGYGLNQEKYKFIVQYSDVTRFENYINYVIELIEKLIMKAMPSKYIIIAVDGVPPTGKITQQRSRRYISQFINSNPAKLKLKTYEKPLFNTTVITPGTEFMFEVDRRLKLWLKEFADKSICDIIYSSFLEPGEGEHKIMHILRDKSLVSDNDLVLISAMDADLIMLGLLSPINNLYLLRNDYHYLTGTPYPENRKGGRGSNFNPDQSASSFPGQEGGIINIATLRAMIKTAYNLPSAVDDFVLLFYLNGNDFLPRCPAINEGYPKFYMEKGKRIFYTTGIEAVLNAYLTVNVKYHLSLINLNADGSASINLYALHQLFAYLAKQESQLLSHEAGRSLNYPHTLLNNAMLTQDVLKGGIMSRQSSLDYFKFRAEWYTHEFKTRLAGVELYPDIDAEVGKMCEAYVQTLNWNYNYYKFGIKETDINWTYPYYRTPLFIDLANYTQDLKMLKAFPMLQQEPLDLLSLLIAVIPPQTPDLLPDLAKVLLKVDQTYQVYRPEKFQYDQFGKQYEDEINAYLPIVDTVLLKRLRQIYNNNDYIYQNSLRFSFVPAIYIKIEDNRRILLEERQKISQRVAVDAEFAKLSIEEQRRNRDSVEGRGRGKAWQGRRQEGIRFQSGGREGESGERVEREGEDMKSSAGITFNPIQGQRFEFRGRGRGRGRGN